MRWFEPCENENTECLGLSILGGGEAGFLNPEGYKEESEDEDDEDEDGDEDEDEDEDENEDEGEGEDGDGDGVEDEDEDGDEDQDEHADENEDEDEDERSRLPLHFLRSNKKGFFSHESRFLISKQDILIRYVKMLVERSTLETRDQNLETG